jgi:hypothetical protein
MRYELGESSMNHGEKNGQLKCVDGPDCLGHVQLRDPIGVPRPMPRCDRHWELRLLAKRRFEDLFSEHVRPGDSAAQHRRATA